MLVRICPGGGIGRHAGLRSQCASVTVRVRPGAPYDRRVVSSVGRASALHAECRQFETVTTHQAIRSIGRPVKATDC